MAPKAVATRFGMEYDAFFGSDANRKSYKAVLAYLRKHSRVATPIKSSELEAEFGIYGRMVRQIVKFARRDGVAIASNNQGYFIARKREDIEPTLDHMRYRMNSIKRTINAIHNIFD